MAWEQWTPVRIGDITTETYIECAESDAYDVLQNR